MIDPERFLCIYPDGSLKWIITDYKHMCASFRKAIGCDWLENVYTVLPDTVIIVDEVGKVKQNPQSYNPVASRLYRGSDFGDPIVGPAVVAAIHHRLGESDWVPLSAHELYRVCSHLKLSLAGAVEVHYFD